MINISECITELQDTPVKSRRSINELLARDKRKPPSITLSKLAFMGEKEIDEPLRKMLIEYGD